MNSKTWMIYIGLLGLLMGGCTIGTETPSPEGEQVQQPAPTPEEPPKVFEEVPPEPRVDVSGLIPQTPPEKVNLVVGRPDPFALMPIQPTISIDPEKAKEKAADVPKVPPIPGVPQPNAKTNPTPNPQTQQGQTPGNGSVIPGTGEITREIPRLTPDGKPFSPTLPALPDPALAREVTITGVIEVAGVPQVILQAPGEPTSRYVRVGDYLSNGQVLVKRVEMNFGSVPVVVLEQFGVEVSRGVGQPAEPSSDQQEMPTASLPSLPSLPNS